MKRKLKLIVYKSPDNGQFYWRIRGANGNILADGGEGYTTKRMLMKSVERIFLAGYSGMIEIVEAAYES